MAPEVVIAFDEAVTSCPEREVEVVIPVPVTLELDSIVLVVLVLSAPSSVRYPGLVVELGEETVAVLQLVDTPLFVVVSILLRVAEIPSLTVL